MKKSTIERIKGILLHYAFKIRCRTSPLLRKQIKNPEKIPIIIINFNNLFYIEKLINFLIERNFKNIIIIDNNSDYPPLLEYYQKISPRVQVEFLKENKGHMAFFDNEDLQKKYGKGFYVVTDPDIVPNENLPSNFMEMMIHYLEKYFRIVNKVGFALKTDDIPDYYPLKGEVQKWEEKFWKWKLEENVYKAIIDTTFALYKPSYPKHFTNFSFFDAVRIAGPYTAQHGGWYVDPNNYTEENLHYIKTAVKSSSWKLNEKGEHDNRGEVNYNRQ